MIYSDANLSFLGMKFGFHPRVLKSILKKEPTRLSLPRNGWTSFIFRETETGDDSLKETQSWGFDKRE